MKTMTKLTAATAIAALLAGPVFAQQTLTGVEAVNDRIDDIQDAANDDIARGADSERFGPNGVPQGWRGSLAFSASASSGSADTGEISLGARLTYGIGAWSHSFGAAGEFAQSGKNKTKDAFFGTFESARYFNDRVYAFGLGRYQYDGQSTNIEQEAFIGFGPGVRIVNTKDVAWRVQAGPGIRWVKDAAGNEFNEGSGILSSRFYYGFSDVVSVTNDTDFLFSDHSTTGSNDLGLNFKMSDTFSTRISYRTDYNSLAPKNQQYDNTLGASLVVGF